MRQQIHPLRRRHYFEPLEPRRLLSLTVPVYNSLPGSPHTIYLDFLGASAFTWNNGDGNGNYAVHGPGGAGTPVPAFSTDSDTSNFSTSELSAIQAIWATVAEKYSPFNVNVTTVDPGSYGDNQAIKVVIGGSHNDWYQQNFGGVAAIGGFTSAALPNVCFIWTDGLSVWDASTQGYLAGTAAAHEAGHEMGLKHERSQPTAGGPITEYYTGDTGPGGIRPIMGDATSGGWVSRGIWWKTNAIQSQQKSPDPVQDELSILSGVLGYRADDHTAVSPPPMSLLLDGEFTGGSGIIEQPTDTDVFAFTPTTSRVTFTVSNSPNGGMLAPQAAIFRASDAAIAATTLTTTSTGCTISCSSLTPGTTYELSIYNDGTYGNLGQYTITGSQQQFATYDSTDRFVNVGGFDGNNNITLSVVPSTPTNANDPGQLLISDSVNGGTANTQMIPMNGMNLIYVNLGSGSDTLTVNPTAALNGFAPHPGIQFDGGGGSNTLIMNKGSATTGDFNVNSTIEISFATTDVVFHNVQAVDLQGNSSTTNYYINDWENVCPLTLIGGTGIDNFYVEPQVTNSLGSSIETDGGGGSGSNTLTWDSSTVTQAKTFNVFDGEITSAVSLPSGEGGGSGGGGQRDVDFSGITTLVVNGTALADAMTVYSLASTTALMFHSGDGNDEVTLGDSADNLDLSYVAGPVYFYGDGGTNYGYLDDASSTTAHQYVGDHTHIGTTVGGNLYNVNDSVQYLTIDGGDTNGSLYTIYEGQPGVTLIVNCGAGSDSINFDNATTWNAYVYGNGGLNSFTVDDRSGASAPFRTTIDDHSVSHYYGTTTSFTGYTIYYANIGSANYYGAPTTNLLNVLSTSSDIASGYQWTMSMNTGNDTINLYPHNTVTGAATILSPLGIIGGGGADTLNIDDSADPTAVSYDFYNPYGSGQYNITGSGLGMGAVGMKTTNVMGGPGSDYYRIDSFETNNALNIYGNGGNDTVDFTPSSENLAANVTALPTFDFVGGAGSDTMRCYNDNGTGPFTYIQTSTYLEAANPSTNYFLVMQDSQVETIYASGTAQADTINVNSVPSGATFQVAGGAGLDSMTISGGTTQIPAAQQFSSLAINGGTVQFTAGAQKAISTNALAITNGQLDLVDSGLVVNGMTPSAVGAFLASGAITSSLLATHPGAAIGYGPASAVFASFPANFLGQPVNSSAVLARFTLEGDANLDQTVNTLDFAALARNFNHSAATFSQGDFNYDGKVNALDFNILATKFGTILASPALSAIPLGEVISAATLLPSSPQPRLFSDQPVWPDDSVLN